MTDPQDLATLTIKELRQLAGEHGIPNRSKLGKDELIDALRAALAGGGAAAPADDDGDDADDAGDAACAPPAPAAEPEVIGADAVAGPIDAGDQDDDEDDEDDAEMPFRA